VISSGNIIMPRQASSAVSYPLLYQRFSTFSYTKFLSYIHLFYCWQLYWLNLSS